MHHDICTGTKNVFSSRLNRYSTVLVFAMYFVAKLLFNSG